MTLPAEKGVGGKKGKSRTDKKKGQFTRCWEPIEAIQEERKRGHEGIPAASDTCNEGAPRKSNDGKEEKNWDRPGRKKFSEAGKIDSRKVGCRMGWGRLQKRVGEGAGRVHRAHPKPSSKALSEGKGNSQQWGAST